jgi:hypothetical protein
MWAQFEKEHSRVVECLDQRGKGRNGWGGWESWEDTSSRKFHLDYIREP